MGYVHAMVSQRSKELKMEKPSARGKGRNFAVYLVIPSDHVRESSCPRLLFYICLPNCTHLLREDEFLIEEYTSGRAVEFTTDRSGKWPSTLTMCGLDARAAGHCSVYV